MSYYAPPSLWMGHGSEIGTFTVVGPSSDLARVRAEYVRLEHERLNRLSNMTIETVPAPSPIDLEAKAARMLAIRESRARLKAEYERHDAVFTAELEQLELEVRGHLSAQNVKSVRTTAGTIMLQESQRYWPSDWESFYAFVHQHAAYHLLERRIHNTHMTQFLEAHPGEYPVGLNVDREVKAVVRKAT